MKLASDEHVASLLEDDKRDLQLSIAGVAIEIVGLSKTQYEVALLRFRPCLAEHAKTDVAFEVSTLNANQFPARPSGVFYYRIALQHEAERILISGLNFSATLDRAASRVSLHVSDDSDSFLGSLENTLRVACAYRLLERETLLLHSVAITDERKGFVCIGRSGAGKSTLATLAASRGLRILSDELNALPLDNVQMRMQPLPFAGDFGRSSNNLSSAPVTGLFALEQSQSSFVSHPSRAEALSRLIAASPYVNVDPFISDRIDALAEKLCERYGMAILHFAKKGDFWEVLSHDRP